MKRLFLAAIWLLLNKCSDRANLLKLVRDSGSTDSTKTNLARTSAPSEETIQAIRAKCRKEDSSRLNISAAVETEILCKFDNPCVRVFLVEKS